MKNIPAKSGEPFPIAVIGLSCRVPGADDAAGFWKLLMNRGCAVRDIPATRLGRPYAVPGAPIRSGLLDGIELFDARFFEISPREAIAMDPQQRMFLEVSGEALDDAGQNAERLSGSATGVYVAVCTTHYWDYYQAAGISDVYGLLGGGARATTPGRVSYVHDLRGPSLVLDTACSSSLAAIALACESLSTGECEMAIAGGTQLTLTPGETESFNAARLLSYTGCQFGSASADGFVRSEGVGAVVLKPLAAAVADGDPVHAVIRGWAMNNDGAGGGGMGTPSRAGQEQLLRAAYRRAAVDVTDVDYVEAHGTGTPVGDPVEISAISDVLGEGRPADRPLIIGSVKSNIGHPEAAAGVIGLIKAVLCLRHETIPPTLHDGRPNPAAGWSGIRLASPDVGLAMTAPADRPLTVGVSGFGIGGTNAHLVLSSVERPAAATAVTAGAADAEQILTLSARSPQALRDRARDLLDFLSPGGNGRDHALADICHTAAARRTHHEYRLAVRGDTHDAMAERLRDALRDGIHPDPVGPARVAFVFSGHGSQHIGMGAALAGELPAFGAALHRCDEAVRAETTWSVLDALTDERRMADVDMAQPALWAVQVALSEAWQSWGVRPDVVIGHSMGEAAAAYTAGALSLADAAAVICRRSRLLREHAGPDDGMAIVGVSAADATDLIAKFGADVELAATNGPRSTVLSGDLALLGKLSDELTARGLFCRVMSVAAASHCSRMEPLREPLERLLAGIEPRSARLPIVSTVTGEEIDGALLDAGYWTDNLRRHVRFQDAVLAAARSAETIFVEISPHPVLTGAVRDILADNALPGRAVVSLTRDQPERAALLESLAAVYQAGAAVDWSALYPTGRVVPLPSYPWQRERYWLDAVPEPTPAGQELAPPDAEPERSGPSAEEVVLDPTEDYYVPGAMLPVEAARALCALAAGTGTALLTDVTVAKPLPANPPGPVVLRAEFEPAGPDSWRFVVLHQSAGAWTRGCAGTAIARDMAGEAEPASLTSAMARCPRVWTADRFYRHAQRSGWATDARHRVVTTLLRGDDEALARLVRPEALGPLPGHPVHPLMLHAALQPLLMLLPRGARLSTIGVRRFEVVGPETRLMWSHVRVTERLGDGTLRADVELLDSAERLVATLSGLTLRAVGGMSGLTRGGVGERLARWWSGGGIGLAGEVSLRPSTSGRGVELRCSLRGEAAMSAEPGGSPRFAPPESRPRELTPRRFTPAQVTPAQVTPAQVRHEFAPRRVEEVPTAGAAPRPEPERQPQREAAEPVPVGPPSEPDLTRLVAAEVAKVLRMPVEQVDLGTPLKKLGLDSLMATELRRVLESGVGVRLPASRLVGASAADLAAELAGSGVPHQAPEVR